MRGRKRGEIPVDLSRAAGRFAQWRQTRVLGARIPAALWDAAVELACRHGVSRTVAALGVRYDTLKNRVAERGSLSLGGEESVARPAFLELPASSLAAPSECVIEFENARGARMRVQVKGCVPDLVALGRSLWDAK